MMSGLRDWGKTSKKKTQLGLEERKFELLEE